MKRISLLRRALLVNSALVAVALGAMSWLFVSALEASFQKQIELRAESAAEFIATQSELALLVGDQAALQQLARNALSTEDVVYMRVTSGDGAVVQMARPGFPLAGIPPFGRTDGERGVRTLATTGDRFRIIEGIRAVTTTNRVIEWESAGHAGRRIGTVQVGVSTQSQHQMLRATVRKALGGACVAVLLIIALHYLHLRSLLLPLKVLIGFTKRVAAGDLRAMAQAHRADELGEVTGAFNHMVSNLEESRNRVAERTRELQDQVTAKEAALAQLAEAQHRLMELSRQSGMAEVATGVLHNVGNVLNSVNVSTTLVTDKVREFRVDNLVALAEMLNQHQNDLADFLHSDPKGARLLPYLSKLGKHFQEERKSLISELELLRDNVGHIKEIVATQQSYARVSGLTEEVSVQRLAEDALRIAAPGLRRHHIEIERDYEEIPPVLADKHKILQILLNLVRNAQQAIKDGTDCSHVVQIRIRRHEGERVRIEVRDRGVGLAKENLTRIFAHGFTTKRDGHGFGLHSGALAAKEMGGALWAESEGLGLGATFVLELPIGAADRNSTQRSTV